jgi:hypothetical protein
MVSVLTSKAVDCGFEPRRIKPKTIKLIFVASPLSTPHYGERAKIGWLGIRIMYPNGVIFLLADCCYSELALCKSNSAYWSRTSGPHHHLIKCAIRTRQIYVINKELQHFDDFILCVALLTFRFVLDKIS